MARGISEARWAAYRVLRKVAREQEFATDLLHSEMVAGLDDRDLGLAEELAMGVLRRQGELDWAIAQASGRPAEKLDLEVLLALRLGVYQLRHLDRVPARAAVSESVEIVKRARKSSAAGLVNAVLRSAAEDAGSAAPPAAEWAVPRWMMERWRKHFGDERAGRLAAATLEEPPMYLRVNARFDVEETLRLLAAEGVETEATEAPLCRRVKSGRPSRTECFRQGRVRIQDIGSQRVGALVELGRGQSFLDVCAAPGGKTFQALEQRGGDGPAVACDRSYARLMVMRGMGTMPVEMIVLDAGRALPFRMPFDRILVDAPCSGTGTLARNPEIKWKLRPDDIEDLAARQRAMLGHALEALAPGGRLVYSTCSLEPEEGEQVFDAAVDTRFEKLEQRRWFPGEQEGDGFFVCVLRRP
jgi:16S rRNA (cytosine967-C5)-methyltransferase